MRGFFHAVLQSTRKLQSCSWKIIDCRALGIKPVIKLSEINRRCRSVLSVDFGSAMDYSIIAIITMRAWKLRTRQLGMSRWSVGRWPTSAGKRRFTGVRRHLGQTPSDLCQELLGADTQWSKYFQCRWKKVVGASEWVVLVLFSNSCSLSGTGTGDGALLQISVSHCRFPRLWCFRL